ncbi:spike base protein, RCAP_Rcc01079 family [Qingshengfaniella alkalisoli]|uniref:spike base protein, RCAP_Rcc01079 family n=1 Tax=Qingshengfaniella alkalisoli TaxID=2599296 RepID=UPI003B848837
MNGCCVPVHSAHGPAGICQAASGGFCTEYVCGRCHEGQISPGKPIVPDDAQPLPQLPRAFYVGGTGDVAVEMFDGQTLTLANMQGGLTIRSLCAGCWPAARPVALW